jgi:hypothetical protein
MSHKGGNSGVLILFVAVWLETCLLRLKHAKGGC